jgi:protein-tyrosine phosphatase
LTTQGLAAMENEENPGSGKLPATQASKAGRLLAACAAQRRMTAPAQTPPMPQKRPTEFRDDEGFLQRLRSQLRRNFAGPAGLARLLMTNADYLLGSAVKFTRPDLSRVDRLVFVCMANLKRSAFAQAVSQQAGFNTASFGLHTVTGQHPLPRALRVALEMGYDFGDHRSTDILNFRPRRGDLYLVMELRHAYQLVRQGFPQQQIALLGYWSRPQRLHIHDPNRKGEDYMRSCFTLIQSAVLNLGRELQALERARRRSQPAPPVTPTPA